MADVDLELPSDSSLKFDDDDAAPPIEQNGVDEEEVSPGVEGEEVETELVKRNISLEVVETSGADVAVAGEEAPVDDDGPAPSADEDRTEDQVPEIADEGHDQMTTSLEGIEDIPNTTAEEELEEKFEEAVAEQKADTDEVTPTESITAKEDDSKPVEVAADEPEVSTPIAEKEQPLPEEEAMQVVAVEEEPQPVVADEIVAEEPQQQAEEERAPSPPLPSPPVEQEEPEAQPAALDVPATPLTPKTETPAVEVIDQPATPVTAGTPKTPKSAFAFDDAVAPTTPRTPKRATFADEVPSSPTARKSSTTSAAEVMSTPPASPVKKLSTTTATPPGSPIRSKQVSVEEAPPPAEPEPEPEPVVESCLDVPVEVANEPEPTVDEEPIVEKKEVETKEEEYKEVCVEVAPAAEEDKPQDVPAAAATEEEAPPPRRRVSPSPPPPTRRAVVASPSPPPVRRRPQRSPSPPAATESAPTRTTESAPRRTTEPAKEYKSYDQDTHRSIIPARMPSQSSFSSWMPADSKTSYSAYSPWASNPTHKYRNEYTTGYTGYNSSNRYVSQFDDIVGSGAFSRSLYSTDRILERSRSRTRERQSALRSSARSASNYYQHTATYPAPTRRRDYSSPPSSALQRAPSRSGSFISFLDYSGYKQAELSRSRSSLYDSSGIGRSSSRSAVDYYTGSRLSRVDSYVKDMNRNYEYTMPSTYASYRSSTRSGRGGPTDYSHANGYTNYINSSYIDTPTTRRLKQYARDAVTPMNVRSMYEVVGRIDDLQRSLSRERHDRERLRGEHERLSQQLEQACRQMDILRSGSRTALIRSGSAARASLFGHFYPYY